MHTEVPPGFAGILAACLRYRWPAIAVASVLLALATFIVPGASLSPGLDHSWAYGINYAASEQLVAGRDVVFTFGPLGFLEHPRPLSNSLIVTSTWFWFSCSILTSALLLTLATTNQPSPQWLANIALVVVLTLALNNNPQRLLMVAYAGVFLHWNTRRHGLLALVALAAGVALLIKFSYGAAVLALLLPYLVLLWLAGEPLRRIAPGLIAIPLCLLLMWLAIYGDFAGLVGYLRGGLAFSQGSASAMALNPPNHWPAILAFLGTFVFIIALLGTDYRQRLAWMPLCFLGPLFIWLRYAFGREDPVHLSFLLAFAGYCALLFAVAARTWQHKLSMLLALPILFITWQDMHRHIGPPYPGLPTWYTATSHTDPTDANTMAAAWREHGELLLQPLALPPRLRATIGEASVDIYPWESAIAAANKLHWTPRPVFQNYVTNTPYLDQLNQDFYSGDRAPRYVLWHHHSFADIDDRYPFSSDPLTLAAILQHYQLRFCEQPFCLWEHTNTLQADIQYYPAPAQARWDEWIPVPNLPGDALRLHVTAERTAAGRLNLALWKEGGLRVEYRLSNGDVHHHRLAIDNAEAGLWASPYFDSPAGPARQPEPVPRETLSQWLSAPQALGHFEDVMQTGNRLQVRGWGAVPVLPTDRQQVTVLMYNEKVAFAVAASPQVRPGISEYMGTKGSVDLDTAGLQESIDLSQLPSGQYALRFVVENDGKQALSPAQDLSFTAGKAAAAHNVAAIRLLNQRPWAYTDTLALHWSTLTFRGDRPW